MLLGNDHDLYEGNLKTTGDLTNCVLSFNVQGSVLTVFRRTRIQSETIRTEFLLHIKISRTSQSFFNARFQS